MQFNGNPVIDYSQYSGLSKKNLLSYTKCVPIEAYSTKKRGKWLAFSSQSKNKWIIKYKKIE